MLASGGDPHLNPLHVLSSLLVAGGFILLAGAWRALYAAQQAHRFATTGPHAHVRHRQYMDFILIMLGFLLQWPTLLTLAMFPVLVWMYVRLARREEREGRAEFGETCARYAGTTPESRAGARLRGIRSTPELIAIADDYAARSLAPRDVAIMTMRSTHHRTDPEARWR